MIEPITVQEVMRLKATKHVVYVYPRKRVVAIDGGRCKPVKGVTDWKALASQINGKKQ